MTLKSPHLQKTDKTFNSLNQIHDPDTIKVLITGAVNAYNNQAHGSLFQTPPNFVENALLIFNTKQENENKHIFQLAAKNSHKAKELELLKAHVIQQYEGNWLQFFVDCRIKMEKNHAELLFNMEKNHAEILSSQQKSPDRIIAEHVLQLKFILEEVRSELSDLKKCEKIRELQEKVEQERRKLRKNRKHQ